MLVGCTTSTRTYKKPEKAAPPPPLLGHNMTCYQKREEGSCLPLLGRLNPSPISQATFSRGQEAENDEMEGRRRRRKGYFFPGPSKSSSLRADMNHFWTADERVEEEEKVLLMRYHPHKTSRVPCLSGG